MAEHFIRARSAPGGSTAVISAKCSSTKGRYHTAAGSTAMTGAQFEISIDGVSQTYRDRKDLALLAAQILKSRNPNSVVKLKDLESEEEIVIAFK